MFRQLILILAIACAFAADRPPDDHLIKAAKQITSATTAADIFRSMGTPDSDIGSGIYIMSYQLKSGGSIMVSGASRNWHVTIQDKNGRSTYDWQSRRPRVTAQTLPMARAALASIQSKLPKLKAIYDRHIAIARTTKDPRAKAQALALAKEAKTVIDSATDVIKILQQRIASQSIRPPAKSLNRTPNG